MHKGPILWKNQACTKVCTKKQCNTCMYKGPILWENTMHAQRYVDQSYGDTITYYCMCKRPFLCDTMQVQRNNPVVSYTYLCVTVLSEGSMLCNKELVTWGLRGVVKRNSSRKDYIQQYREKKQRVQTLSSSTGL